jgi:hypothetical protein
MKKIFGIFILTLVLISCGGNKDGRPVQDYLSAFLNGNEKIVAFGKADLNTILNKSEYKKIPKFGLVISKELESYKKSLNTETPIFFALEGPFLEDGTPETSYAFFEVVNTDSLTQKLMQQGFDLEKSGDIQFFQSGDVSFGIRNNLAILISKKTEFDGKKLLAEAFDKSTEDVSEGKIDEILNSKGDVVLGMSIANLYGTSNTDLSDLSADKQKSIKELAADSYMQTTMAFENGAIVIETKNYFSDLLKSKMFFKKDGGASIVSKLGTGNPKIGLSVNIDMKKVQAFMDEYSPGTMADLMDMLGGEAQMAMAMGGSDGLAGLLNGEVAAVMVGEPNAYEGMSDFNVYVGLGKNGRTLAEGFKGLLSLGMAKVDLDKNGLSAFSSMNFVPQAGKKLNVPAGCEIFGKKGITAFVNFEGIDLTSFEFEDAQKMIYLIKYVTFEMDENGSKIVIKAKNGKENVLKQAMDVVVKELSGKIGNMTI